MYRYIFLATLLPSLCLCDYTDQATFAKCVDGYSIDVGSYNDRSGDQEYFGKYINPSFNTMSDEFIYDDYKSHELNCSIAGQKIKILFSLDKPRMHGPCSSVPGGNIVLFINGTQITNRLTYNTDCYSSLDGISISTHDGTIKSLKYKFCGHSNSGSSFPYDIGFNGCIEYSQKYFSEIINSNKYIPINSLLDLKE